MESITAIADLVNLEGKTAVVTGGAKGIGLGIVRRLHQANAKVLIADVDVTAAETVADQLNQVRNASAMAMSVDVTDPDNVQHMVAASMKTFGSLDILVNNAGIFPAVSVRQMTDDNFQKVLNVNIRGPFLCTKYASEQMIIQGAGGRIINITSIDAVHPSMIGLAHYDASKHALWGFTKNVALELAPYKIWVNAIAPGGIATPGVAQIQTDNVDPKIVEDFLAKIPMHRMGNSDEIGTVALFLASDMASYMTGAQLVVDGGALLS